MVAFKAQVSNVNKEVIRGLRELCVRENTDFVCWICNESEVEWHPVVPTKAVSKVTSGLRISDVDDAYLLQAFTRDGQLLVVQHEQAPVLIENDYCFLVFLRSVLRRHVKDRVYQQRSFTLSDTQLESFVSGFKKHGVCKPSLVSKREHIYLESFRKSAVSKRAGRSEAPRSSHVTKPLADFDNCGTCSSLPEYITAPCFQETGGPAVRDEPTSASAALVKNRGNIPGQFVSNVESRYRSFLSADGHDEPDCPQTNSPPPRHVMYTEPTCRLESFLNHLWPANNRPSIQILVDRGFFYTGRGDLVRCYQCGIGMKDWSAEDNPLVEHVRHSPTCPFLMRILSRSELQKIKNDIAQLTSGSAEQGYLSNSTSENNLPFPIRSPRYQTMESRLATFTSFPGPSTIKHSAFAIAGLYYTGNNDLCRCFTCDGGLKAWVSTDDPIEEHAKYFPECAYVKHLKGENYVRDVQEKLTSNQTFWLYVK